MLMLRLCGKANDDIRHKLVEALARLINQILIVPNPKTKMFDENTHLEGFSSNMEGKSKINVSPL
jgi:hypothetical protein